jgi:predicted PurR-regulated permease PerM
VIVQPQSESAASRRPRSGSDLVLLAFAIAVLLVLAWFVRGALLIVYVSAVFAVVLKPAVDWLHRRSIFGWRPGRGTALLLLVTLMSLFVAALIGIALPSVISNAGDFAATMPRRLTELQHRIRSLPFLGHVDMEELGSYLSAWLAGAVPTVGGAMTSILSGLLLTAYFILDGAALLGRLLTVFPLSARSRLDATLNRAGKRMRHWLAGQALLMAILGGSAAVTFGLMGLPYFYLLAVFAAVANIVPLLGPLVTVLVAGAVAATQSLWDLLGVMVFYLVYQQVENAFLTPNIMKAQVQLSSAIIIVALLVGSVLAGIAGALVAVPSAVLIAEVAGEYLTKERGESHPDE